MAPDKYTATWVSHSSSSDFLKCPRLYFLRSVYKDPKTGRKITLMQPPLALGGVVHDVIESLSILPVEERLAESPVAKFEREWEKVSGKKGGFKDKTEEEEFKERGRQMTKRVADNPGPILNKAVKIPQELPYYWLSEEDNIILCGKIDWLEYLPETDGVHIIDFKTGKWEEGEDSLQLPIYNLLVTNTQKRNVERVSYWYLNQDKGPRKMTLPELAEARAQVYEVAKRMKLARSLEHFRCPKDGCEFCGPLEEVKRGKGLRVGVSEYNQDIYVLL